MALDSNNSVPDSSLVSLIDASLSYLGDPEQLVKAIRENLIGHKLHFNGPFGQRQVLEITITC